MKQIILILLFCTFSELNAQDTLLLKTPAEVQIQLLEERNRQLEAEQALYLTAKQEREQLINTVTSIFYLLGGLLTLLGISGWYSYMQLRKKVFKKLKAHHETTISEEIRRIRKSMLDEVAKELKTDPKTLRDVLQKEISDNRLKANTEISLIGDNDQKIKSIQNQLTKWGINEIGIKVINPDDLNQYMSEIHDNKLYFIVDNDDNGFAKSSKHREEKIPIPVFYLGSGYFETDFSKIQNFSKSPVTIYQNLMDLIRYIDFQKSTSSSLN